jgi:hypothetical protein
MSDHTLPAGIAEEFLALAREKAFDKPEVLWMQRLEKLSGTDLPELFAVAEYLVRKKHSDQAALLLWSLVQTVTEKGNLREALLVAARAAAIAPEAAALREELVALYRRFAPDVAELDQIVAASPPVPQAAPTRRWRPLLSANRTTRNKTNPVNGCQPVSQFLPSPRV